jgi:hypothetical protein
MNLLERDINKWKQSYLYGQKQRINRGMAFGKQMADGLEHEEASGDPVLDLLMARLPKFEIMDREFRTLLKNGKESIPILIKPDTMTLDMTGFKEYKTGQEPWTKKKVDDDNGPGGQIGFYATGIFLITGHIPPDIELVHVQTTKTNKDASDSPITATGEIFRHKTVRTMSQVINMMVRMKRAWTLIQKITAEELL